MRSHGWLRENIGEDLMRVMDELNGATVADPRGWTDSLALLSHYFQVGTDGDVIGKVENAIAKLGLSDKKALMAAFWHKISPSISDLIKTLNELVVEQRGEIAWPIVNKEIKYGEIEGPWRFLFDVNGNGQMALEVEARDHVAEVDLDAADNGAFLRIGLNGKLTLDAAASVPVDNINLAGGGGLGGQSEIDYYFDNDRNIRLIQAMWENLHYLASPFDPEKILAEKAYGLEAVRFQAQGNVRLSIGLKANKTWGASIPVRYSPRDLATQLDVGVTGGLGFEAGIALSGEWVLAVRPTFDDKLHVEIKRGKSKEESLNLSLDGAIGISGLDKLGDAIARRYVPDPENLLDKLKAYIDWEELLRAYLTKFLGDAKRSEWFQNMKQSLARAGSVDDAVDIIKTAILDGVDDVTDPLILKGNEVGRILAQKSAGILNLNGSLYREYLAKTTGALADFFDDTQEKLRSEIEAILEKYAGKLDNLLKPLLDMPFGQKVRNAIAEGAGGKDKLISPTIDFIERYREIRRKIITAVAGAARLKIGLNLSHLIARDRGREILLALEIDPAIPGAREFYRKMLVGSLDELLSDLREGVPGDMGVTVTGGSVKSYVSEEITTSISFDIFGFKASSKSILTAGVDAFWDVNGDVVVYKSRSGIQKMSEGFGELRNLQFVNLFEITGLRESRKTKFLNMGLSISYQDENITSKEVKQFLGSFARWGLVLPDTTGLAVQWLQEQKENKLKKAAIGLSMAMTGEDVLRIIEKDDPYIIKICIDRLIETLMGQWEGEEFKTFFSRLQNGEKDYYTRIMEIDDSSGSVIHELQRGRGRMNKDKAKYIWRATKNMLGAVSVLGQALEYRVTETDDLEIHKERINALNKRFNEHLSGWLKVRQAFTGLITEEMPGVTISFIRVILQLMSDPYHARPRYLSPVIRWGDQRGEIFM